jgi:hypothetical protein
MLSSLPKRVCNATMGMCENRSNPCYHQSGLSNSRVGRCLVLSFSPPYSHLRLQIETIRLAGISYLFLVPQIRTSSYLTLLSEALPSLRKFSPGNIQEEALPDLKHVVVVDNTHQPKRFHEMLGDIHCAIDFREVLLWQDKSKEGRLVEEAERSLNKDDVTNLQFTRSFSFFWNRPAQHTESDLKWNDWQTKSCLCEFRFYLSMAFSC